VADDTGHAYVRLASGLSSQPVQSRLEFDLSGGTIVIAGDGVRYRVVDEEALGFVGNAGRPPSKRERTEAAKRAPFGVENQDPWSEMSSVGRTAVHVVAPEGLLLLRRLPG
jgi:hypothetical protein